MSEERPQHTQEPAEGGEEDVQVQGADRASSGEGSTEKAEDRPSARTQEPAEGGEEDVESPGADQAGGERS
jgi:hypothetical protein